MVYVYTLVDHLSNSIRLIKWELFIEKSVWVFILAVVIADYNMQFSFYSQTTPSPFAKNATIQYLISNFKLAFITQQENMNI